MSQLNVDNIQNRTGSNGGPNFPSGITVAVGQTAYIHGNLQVDGTETIINTETLNVSDKTVGIGSTSNASNTTADGSGIEIFASSSQTGNNKTLTWSNTSNSWDFGPNDVGLKIGTGVTANASGVTVTGVVTATSFKGDGSQLSGIDATAIQTGNTSVQTVDTGSDGHVKMTTEGSERVRVGPAGQIGLGGANYGSSGQLLTSGGSGSAPTWTTVSSAPEVSGTANGDIAAGKPVIVNADGSVGQVKYNYTALSPYQYTTYDTTIMGNDAYWTKVGYDSTNNQFLYFWKSTQQSNQGNLTIGTPTGTTTGTNVTIGNHQMLVTQVGDTGDIVWSKTSALGVAIYSYGSGIFVKAFTSDGTTITTGTELNICGNGSSLYPTISWDESSDKFLVVVGDNAANSNYAEAYVVSHSGTTLTKGSAVTVKLSQAKHADLAYDSDNNRHLLTYSHQQDSDKLCGRIITVSGTVPTVHAETKDTATTSVYNTRATYIPGSGKFVTVYGRSNAGYARVVTVDGSNAITFNTESSAIPNGFSGSNYGNMQLATDYDSGLGKVIVAYVDYTGMNASYVVVTTDTSANTITSFSSQAYVRGGNGQSIDVSVAYSSYWQQSGFSAKRGTGGVNAVYWNLTTTSRATNVTGENYLGVANASYTNGQTASIRVSGATQDNQTGLTPGQNYFVQNDGTLGLTAATPKVYAGTAVSSTQLLVGKEAAAAATTPGLLYVTSFIGDKANALANYAIKFEDLDWTNVSYYLFQVNGLSFNGSSFSVTQPEIQLKAGSSWITSSVYYTYADHAAWNNSWSHNNQTAVAARPWVNQTAGDWTGEIYISRSSGYNANHNGANKYMWGRAFSDSRFSNWQCNLTASQFRQNDITGVRFGNSYGYTMGYYGTIDVFKYYSGRA